MSLGEALRGVPERILREERFATFPSTLRPYTPIMGKTIEGDATKLPVPLAQKLPPDHAGNYFTRVNGERYLIQVAKGESIPYAISLRLTSGQDPRFFLEANIFRMPVLLSVWKSDNVPFYPDIKPKDVVMHYDLKTKIDNQHHAPLHAKAFLPWALDVLRPYKPTHVLADWEPNSTNHDAFYEAFNSNGGDAVAAARSTWTHARFTELGFELIPKIHMRPITPDIARMQAMHHGIVSHSDKGYPKTVVRALYKKAAYKNPGPSS